MGDDVKDPVLGRCPMYGCDLVPLVGQVIDGIACRICPKCGCHEPIQRQHSPRSVP